MVRDPRSPANPASARAPQISRGRVGIPMLRPCNVISLLATAGVTANILMLLTLIILMWSSLARAGATEVPKVSFEPESLAAVCCALHRRDRECAGAVRAGAQALRDGEDAQTTPIEAHLSCSTNSIEQSRTLIVPSNSNQAMRFGATIAAPRFSRKHEGQRAIDECSQAMRLPPDLAPTNATRAREFRCWASAMEPL